MIPNQEIDKLAELMSERHVDRSPSSSDEMSPEPGHSDPFVLFLGAGCARAAGVPTLDAIARDVFKSLGQDDELASFVPPSEDQSDFEKLLNAFFKLLDKMSSGQIFRMLQSYYANLPVPMFYQDLAVLVKAGYFNRILTTNFDTLLEQALGGAGLQPDIDYLVTSLGVKEKRNTIRWRTATDTYRTKEPVQIIKLHGNLAQQKINITPGDIEEALMSQRMVVKGGLKGDIVMVGYTFESEPINGWLKKWRRDQLWWVSPQMPHSPDIDIQNWAEQISHITGEMGQPETFFSQLSLRLLRLPMLDSLSKSLKDYEEQPDDYATRFRGIVARVSPSDDSIVAEDLRGNIRRSQALLYSLEQSSPPGERPANIQAQIDYQKRQIAELEDKLRALPSCEDRVKDLMEQMAGAVQSIVNGDDSIRQATAHHLEKQRDIVKEEYGKAPTNQHIISAAIGATILLAERLNISAEAVISPDLIRELASFVPSMTAGRMS